MVVLTVMVTVLAVGILVVCTAYTKEKHMFSKACAFSLCGIGTLGAINLFSAYTGISIALNYFTALISLVFSVPGVVALLFMRVLFLV
ncbi:MAG: pro-sigmaK processing inhibitor BofA family protein [Oscillospiraceae bacterium]